MALPDLAQVLASAPGDCVAGLRRLPAAAQAEALAWIGKEIGLADTLLYEEAMRLLITGGKQVGGAALTALRGVDPARLFARAETLLVSSDTRERLAGVQILGRIIGRDGAAPLRARAEVETVRAVAQALREALLALEAAGTNAAALRSDDETGYCSADGAWIEIPPFELPKDTPFPDGIVDRLRDAAGVADPTSPWTRSRGWEMVPVYASTRRQADPSW